MREPVHALLPPLDGVSYVSIGGGKASDTMLLNLSAAAYVSRHPSVANYFTVELTVLKEISQSLADLFALRLPFPYNPSSVKSGERREASS